MQDFEDDIYLGDPALLRYQLVISILKAYSNNVLAPCLLRLMVLFNLRSIVIVLDRRMSIQKMLRKRIPLHPSWNYVIFT